MGKMFSIMIPTRGTHSLSRDCFSLSLLMNILTHSHTCPQQVCIKSSFYESDQRGNFEILRKVVFLYWERGGGVWTLYVKEILLLRMNLPG